MYSRDYILRMIEQMGQALIALRNSILGRKRSSEKIGDQLKNASRQVGFDLDLARAATPETIMMLIAPFGEVEPGRCWMVAEVLYLDGLQAQMEGRMDDAATSFEKALPLYELLEPGALHLSLPEARERVREIEHALQRLEAGGTPDVPPAIKPEGA